MRNGINGSVKHASHIKILNSIRQGKAYLKNVLTVQAGSKLALSAGERNGFGYEINCSYHGIK